MLCPGQKTSPEKEDKLKLVSSALLEKEVLDGAEVRRLLGLEPKPEPQLEIEAHLQASKAVLWLSK